MAKTDGIGEIGDFDDGNLSELFSSFSDMGASDDLKASTLEFIAAAVPAAAAASGSPAAQAGQPGTPNVSDSAGASKVTVKAGGRRPKPRLRTIRMIAAAASLAIVVTGGAAYATPTSLITLSQGNASIELGVNYFGISVAAESDDAAGRAIVESTSLTHVPCEDAISRAADALDAVAGDGMLELFVESADSSQRERLENMGQTLVSTRNGVRAQVDRSDGESGGETIEGKPADGGETGERVVENRSTEAPSGSVWSGRYSYAFTQPTSIGPSDNAIQDSPADSSSEGGSAKSGGKGKDAGKIEGPDEGGGEDPGKGNNADSNKEKSGEGGSETPTDDSHRNLGSETELEWIIEPDSEAEEEEAAPADEIDYFQDDFYLVDAFDGSNSPESMGVDFGESGEKVVVGQGLSRDDSGQGQEDLEGAPLGK